MNWRTFCHFDGNISISSPPLPIFWSKSDQKFTECGELTFLSPFLISSMFAYCYLFSTVLHRIRHGPSLSHASLSLPETCSLCFKFFSSFGTLTCSIASLVFVVMYSGDSPTPATLVTISCQILSLVFASLSWLSILFGFEAIPIKTFPSAFVGWISIFVVISVRFYDAFRENDTWEPLPVSSLTGLCIHCLFIIVVLIFDVFYRRRPWIRNGRFLEDDEIRFLQFEARSTAESGIIYLGPGDERANFVSKLTFYWTNILMKKGYRGQLTNTEELYYLPGSLNVHNLEQEFTSASRRPSSTSFVRILHSCFGWEFYSLGILKFFSDSLAFAGPILLGYLVDFMTEKTPFWYLGYIYAGAMLATSFLSASFNIHFNFLMNKVGLKVRSVVIMAVYTKLIRVPQFELSRFSSGEMMNFMSTDSERLVNFCRSFHDFWSLPMQIGAALFLLYREVGLAFLAGLGFAIFLIPVNRWIAKKIGTLSTGMMDRKDNRVKLMTELLFGIRVVKFGSWEDSFTRRISSIRQQELKYLKGRKYLDALCVYMWACAPVVIAILTFATYVLIGHRLTAAKVFTSIALFNILIFPLNAFPWVINGVVEAWISGKRLQRFFDLNELDSEAYYSQSCGMDDDASVCMHEATFSWSVPSDRPSRPDAIGQMSNGNGANSVDAPTLRNLTFSFRKGKLIGVIGPVGSGKSSLFTAVLAEMRKLDDGGSIYVRDVDSAGVAYTSQEPWLQHGTVRQNILFGKPYQTDLYEAVVTACALTNDFKLMPNGDLSDVGEQGVTLSGGQRARIALARAVYQNKDIYLLDDPLSAVDSHVAKFLFRNCIRGILYGKTVVLATHHVDYLREADLVVVVKGGTIEAVGPPSEILTAPDPASSMESSKTEDVDQKNVALMPNDDERKEETVGGGEPVLVQEEEREVGMVKVRVYSNYLKAVGFPLTLAIFLSLFFMQGSKNVSDWWLSFWVSHRGNYSENGTLSTWLSGHFVAFYQYKYPLHLFVANQYSSHARLSNSTVSNEDIDYYLKIYGIIIGSNTVFALFRAFLYAYGCICAAKTLHIKLFAKILKAPVRFFDTTPVGRLVNRFSSDIYSIDDSLPFQANRLVACLFGIVGTTATMCYGLPWFTVCVLPMAAVYYWVQRYYRFTTCDLKRLTSTSLSPMYSHFTDTLNGLQTIRAFRVSDRFLELNRNLLTSNQRAQYSTLACSQWLSMRLQLIGVAMVGAVAIIAVLEHNFRSVDPGLVGLAISYALSITSLLNGLLEAFTETEKEMVAVERVSDYVENVPSERWEGFCQAPIAWPNSGIIEFKDVKLRYSSDLNYALNGLNFVIRPGEKVGIVGRTGAGKSSILQALFRTVELECGQILIDNFDIAFLDLVELRSRLAIIPQTPFLFSGTVRDNLDVEGRYNDWRLQWAIQDCHLDGVVNRLGGLDGELGERGGGLSLGEKQLFCLARALLANAQILCIDEATAHVDNDTDERIQSTLRRVLPGATVLTIAHRIKTVLDYDRIFVMSEGQIIEEGSPKELLQVPESHFASLAHGLM